MLRKELHKMIEDQAISLHEDGLDVNEDIWQLSQCVRLLRDDLKEFEEDTHRKINEQMCFLEGIMIMCDSLLYNACKLYCDRTKQETDTPEHP